MFAARLAFRSARGTAPSAARISPKTFPYRSTFRPLQQQRFASYQRSRQSGQKYSGFPPFARAQYLWRNYRTPITITSAGGGTFYVLNLEEVPISRRRRFNCVSPELEKQMGGGGYEEMLQQFRGKILSQEHPYTQLVTRVVQRLLPSTGGLAGQDWAVHVIDEPGEKNAFVMPGGKVFVFTGILPICQDENGVATVLSHEIAHNVAHHVAEKLSRNIFLFGAAIAVSALLDTSTQLAQAIINFALELPNSRAQESEADHIGLLIMSESCYDPHAAVDFWDRMREAEKGAPPQFMSTHPSSYNRAGAIKGWLPEAEEKLSESGCAATSSYVEDFKTAFGNQQAGAGRVRMSQSSKEDDEYYF